MRARRDLVLEYLALHQQLATLVSRGRPVIRPADRVFWIVLRHLWSGRPEALAIVRPDTVMRWHRAGSRIYWNWLSRRRRRSGRPPLPLEVRALIRRMATENHWGAPRIHGELLRLGFEVSERSVSGYLRSLPRAPRAGQTWKTFLRNHRDGIAAMDFFSVPTVTLRALYVLFVIRHARGEVVRCAVTTSPTAAWVAQRLRETFPFGSAQPQPLAERGRGALRRRRPAGAARPRHRPRRAPPPPAARLLRRLLRPGPRAPRGGQGLAARAPRRAASRLRDLQRRQPAPGRRPAPPLRLAAGGVGQPRPKLIRITPPPASTGGGRTRLRFAGRRGPRGPESREVGASAVRAPGRS
jgi:hypothetical protein